jgi:hypothetical protein
MTEETVRSIIRTKIGARVSLLMELVQTYAISVGKAVRTWTPTISELRLTWTPTICEIRYY